MSHYCYDRKGSFKRRFFRSRSRGRLTGVCAGIADYFKWNTTYVRVAAILGLLFFTAPTLVAYFLITVLTDKL